MKEKRVDIYLAKAGFAQVALVALFGWAASEAIKGNTNLWVYMAFAGVIISASSLHILYKKARRLTKNKRDKI